MMSRRLVGSTSRFASLAFVSALFLFRGTNGFSAVPLSLSLSPGRLSISSLEMAPPSTIATTPGPVLLFARPNNSNTNNPRRRNHRSRLAANEEGENTAADEASAAAMDKKVAGRKKRLTMGYQLASLAFAASALFSLVAYGGVTSSSLYYVLGGGPLTEAAVLYILKGAAVHDRLGSDTYKRLNIATIAFCIVQLVIPTGTMPWPNRLAFKVPGFLGLVNGIKGYGYGCLGWDKSKPTSAVVADFQQGIRSTLAGMAVVKPKSAGYLLGTLLTGSMSLIKSKELATMLLLGASSATEAPATALSIFVKLSRMARLGLVATIMYTLKDASDRDRLGGTTFVQLNGLMSAAFSSIALYSLGTGSMATVGEVVVVSGIAAMTLFQGLVHRNNAKKA